MKQRPDYGKWHADGPAVLQAAVLAERAELAADVAQLDALRPRTRGECANGVRPCPWAGCRHHLLLSVGRAGSLMYAGPARCPSELGDTCALDVAERGDSTLEQVGQALRVTRERARQLEEDALDWLFASGELGSVERPSVRADYDDDCDAPRRGMR